MTADPSTELPAAPRLVGWDGIEFWVGSARAAAHFYCAAMDFEAIAYAGPETGCRDKVSYVLTQGEARIILTSSITGEGPIAEHVAAHGDGVKYLAFEVTDAAAAYAAAVARGAEGAREPWEETDEHGTVRLASVRTFGETEHVFVQRSGYRGGFLPNYTSDKLFPAPAGNKVGLGSIDHVVGNVEDGRMHHWVEFYERVFGFHQMRSFTEDDIATEYSALRSTVVTNGDGVTMPINEPAEGRKKSQIQEYLDYYHCPGVQHLAFSTRNIIQAIGELKARGLRFLEPPATYYEDARVRVEGMPGADDLPWADLERLGILIDREGDGYLLQLFSEPMTDRPTVFMEIIQREGATGFGDGNFKALFESIEREQARRGNL